MNEIMDEIIDNVIKQDSAKIIQRLFRGYYIRNIILPKKEIIERYNTNIRGKILDTSSKNLSVLVNLISYKTK